jgi:hypothetical protein
MSWFLLQTVEFPDVALQLSEILVFKGVFFLLILSSFEDYQSSGLVSQRHKLPTLIECDGRNNILFSHRIRCGFVAKDLGEFPVQFG